MWLARAVRRCSLNTSPFRRSFSDKPVYSNYTFFKNTGAVSVGVQRPRLAPSANGAFLTMKKQGALLLTFASPKGEHGFDWPNRELFAMSVHELGELLAGQWPVKITHRHSQTEGDTLRKELVFTMRPDDSAVSLQLTTFVGEAMEKRIILDLSLGELQVLRSLASNMIPHLLGWGMCVAPIVEGLGVK